MAMSQVWRLFLQALVGFRQSQFQTNTRKMVVLIRSPRLAVLLFTEFVESHDAETSTVNGIALSVGLPGSLDRF